MPLSRRVLARASLLFASTLLAACVAEIVLRATMCAEAGVQDFTLVRERYLGNRLAIFPSEVRKRGDGLVPNSRIDANTTINSLGFRGKDVAIDKAPGMRRVVCLGGSAAFCTSVSSDLTTWPARLEAIARKRGSRVEVLNGGVPSFTSPESIARFERLFLPLEPDCAVLYNQHNDVVFRRVFRLSYDPREDVPVPIENAVDRMLARSAVYLRVRAMITSRAKHERVARAIAITDSSPTDETSPSVPRLPAANSWGGKRALQEDALREELEARKNPYFVERDLEDYRARLLKFIAVCRANEVAPVLATEILSFPLDCGAEVYSKKGSPILTGYFPNYEWFAEMYRAFNDVIRRVASDEKVTLFDADVLVPRKDAYFSDHVHLTDAGCHALAEQLEKVLRDAGLLDESAGDR